MKIMRTALRYFSFATLFFVGFISCDKDFASIESDIINRDNATNFSTDSQEYNVIAYTDALEPVQTNNLPYYLLGFFDDPNYGPTTASIVTQVSSSLIDPTFAEDINDVVMDSVVLTIPFFSTTTGINDDNEIEYRLDSIFSRSDELNPIKLSIYENNYFLRDFDPNASFDEPQAFFSNRSLSASEAIGDMDLESVLIHTEDELEFSNEQIELWDEDDNVTQVLTPSIRILLDTTYWRTKIIEQQGTSDLRNTNNFNNYFRGLYFKAENISGMGSMAALNLGAQTSNITIYYKDTSEGEDASQKTYTLTFGPNRTNFFDNSFNMPLTDGDNVNGDEFINIKGGQGSTSSIKLFDDENVFEDFKNEFANYNEDGEFESNKRLVNEANLVFYVKDGIQTGQEPDRLFIYDKNNNAPLIDYFIDFTNSSFPLDSKTNHLGPLQRIDDEPDGNGIKYKFRITEHIKSLIQNDSTNVTLGLAVSGNVNLEENSLQRLEQTSGSSENRIPISTIISPRGTMLYGNNTADEARKVRLEIFYTCVENCDNN